MILTNNHEVENATSKQIQFYGDDQRYAARVLGRDRLTDSALLDLVERPARKLPAARFGDSSRMAPGDWVMAIGRALRPQPHGHSRGCLGARPVHAAGVWSYQRDAADRRGDQTRATPVARC